MLEKLPHNQMQGDLTREGNTAQNLNVEDTNVTASEIAEDNSNPIYWLDSKRNEVRTEAARQTQDYDYVDPSSHDRMSKKYSSTANPVKLQGNIQKNVERLINTRMTFNEQVAKIQSEDWLPNCIAEPNTALGILVKIFNVATGTYTTTITYNQYKSAEPALRAQYTQMTQAVAQ